MEIKFSGMYHHTWGLRSCFYNAYWRSVTPKRHTYPKILGHWHLLISFLRIIMIATSMLNFGKNTGTSISKHVYCIFIAFLHFTRSNVLHQMKNTSVIVSHLTWGIKPISLRSLRLVKMEPASKSLLPTIALTRVVFPHPLGPSKAKLSTRKFRSVSIA